MLENLLALSSLECTDCREGGTWKRPAVGAEVQLTFLADECVS
jgi:hypothetical protein